MSKEETITFHHVISKLLYLNKRARPELKLGVAFLCTRVKYPDKDDWKKLTQIMKYIRFTIVTPLILGIDDTNTLRNLTLGIYEEDVNKYNTKTHEWIR